jgi:hypothetical protein
LEILYMIKDTRTATIKVTTRTVTSMVTSTL